MGRANRTGRTASEPFIRLHRGVTGSAAWRSLNCEEKALLLLIWERHNGSNNGFIGLGYREAKDALRIGSGKVTAAFRGLQERGFIVARTAGAFNWKVAAGAGRATEWELTTEPCGGEPPKRLYRDWQIQNAAPALGASGTCTGGRSIETNSENPPNGTCTGGRYARFAKKAEPDVGAHLVYHVGEQEH